MYLASDLGVDAIGLVFCESSPRYLHPDKAEKLTDERPPFLNTVALFKNASNEEIEKVLKQVDIDYLQFHGQEDADFCSAFGFPYIKAIAMGEGSEGSDYAKQIDEHIDYADMLLFDSHQRGADGGSGETFDWTQVPDDLEVPIAIAGGLDANNVGEVIRTVAPFAVDVSSGVEDKPGVKSEERMREFVEAVRAADAECYGEDE